MSFDLYGKCTWQILYVISNLSEYYFYLTRATALTSHRRCVRRRPPGPIWVVTFANIRNIEGDLTYLK
jgi:hypothetical protein